VRRAGVEPHVVYISIVGIDKIPFGYHRGKVAIEQVTERSQLPYTDPAHDTVAHAGS